MTIPRAVVLAALALGKSKAAVVRRGNNRLRSSNPVRKMQDNGTAENPDQDLIQSIYDTTSLIWESEGLDGLSQAVAIDSLSPSFNPDWATTGELHDMLDYYIEYATDKLGNTADITHTIYGGKNATPATPPFLLLKIEADREVKRKEGTIESVLLYTHADTQPHNANDWTYTSDPTVTERVTTEDKDLLYGRGTTDDKYGFFASIIAVQALMDLDLGVPTVYIGVETEEESGSPHLEPYLDQVIEDIGAPTVVYVLDAGGPDNSHMWNTRTLRGLISADMTVSVTESSVHSGTAGGIVPSPLRLMNEIIYSRLEDISNGTIIAPPLLYEPTEEEKDGALELAKVMGDTVHSSMPWLPGVSPMVDPSVTPTTEDIADMLVRNHFQSALAIVGWDHKVIPNLGEGGNIVQPYITARLSFRCSPHTDVDAAFPELKELVESSPISHGANVSLTFNSASPGFSAAPLPFWYKTIVNDAAVHLYGNNMLNTGDGGTIGFLHTIQKKLQETSVIHNTGLFDPSSNGHAPDENLDIIAGKKFTGVLAYTLHKITTEAP